MNLQFIGASAIVNYLYYELPKNWDICEKTEHSTCKFTAKLIFLKRRVHVYPEQK